MSNPYAIHSFSGELSRVAARMRRPAFVWLVAFLLIANACRTRSVTTTSPDVSTKPRSQEANRFDGSNRSDVNDADNFKDISDLGARITEDDSGSDNTQRSEYVRLASAPLIFATTDTEIGVNVVLLQGKSLQLELQFREPGRTRWSTASGRTVKGYDVVQWRIRNLAPSTAYEYRLRYRTTSNEKEVLYRGQFRTRRRQGESFTFCILSDSHIFVNDPNITSGELIEIARTVEADRPDFVVHLGDILDFHYFGFNRPPADGLWTKLGYLFYRNFMGDLLGRTTHFSVIGNWDGENGDFATEEIERSRSQRLLYLPGPDPSTYPQGGSAYQDYFAFTWGDALFIVLNVMSYTPSGHYLSGDIGLPDDWTLGEAQLLWLEETLKHSESKWKMIFIHHAVGGNGGDEANSGYGRGGGRAALVGEQATIHALMQDYDVPIFFYGHDHVFFDMIVDGIHYTTPGSTGAPWKFTTFETGYPADAYWTDSGYARVEVAPNSIDVAFISINDEIIHRYRVD